jgi:GTP-binding protein
MRRPRWARVFGLRAVAAPLNGSSPSADHDVAVNKRTIVTDSKRASKTAPADGTAARKPHPLVGAEFVTGAAAMEQLPAPSVPEIAFAGRSNAGKSTAINVLAGRTRLAFASRTPGRTQQINLFALRSGALVADLPGYGYAAVGKELKRAWQEFLWHYITTRPTLVALVLIVDARHGLKDLDLELLEGFVPSGRPILILATKADKLNTTSQRAALVLVRRQLDEQFPLGAANVTVQLFSATARIGIEEAEGVISRWL